MHKLMTKKTVLDDNILVYEYLWENQIKKPIFTKNEHL